MTKEIKLTQGFVTIVDDEDYEWLSEYNWQVKDKSNSYYACRRILKNGVRQTTSLMHREIMKATENEIIDHINGNGLDNRKENLRKVTQSENSMNRQKVKKVTSSIYKGVYWNKRDKLWCVQIKVNGVKKHVGYFKDEIKAAIAYNEAAVKYYGEYAKLNEIKSK